MIRMSWVVFLRAINVGGANRCQPTQIAEQLAKFGVVNIGAVGTFVVREEVSDSVLRAALARKLPFKCEIMICQAKAVLDLMRRDPFANQPSGPDVVRFVNVLAKPLHPSLVTRHFRYCSSLTFSIQSTTFPLSASWKAMCVIAVVGVAPCQCFSLGGNHTTSPE